MASVRALAVLALLMIVATLSTQGKKEEDCDLDCWNTYKPPGFNCTYHCYGKELPKSW